MEHLIDGMTNLFIECEMPAARRARFRIRYQNMAGHPPDEAFIQIQENKWGIEYRMYFDASSVIVDGLRNAGFHVEVRTVGYGAERAYRINDEELFWLLIQRGRGLGHN